jgi:hypothetical protein
MNSRTITTVQSELARGQAEARTIVSDNDEESNPPGESASGSRE